MNDNNKSYRRRKIAPQTTDTLIFITGLINFGNPEMYAAIASSSKNSIKLRQALEPLETIINLNYTPIEEKNNHPSTGGFN
jgi:hypothetical protein